MVYPFKCSLSHSVRTLAFAAAATAVTACSVGSNPVPQDPPGTQPPCNPKVAVQLAAPLSGSQGNPDSIGHIQIVVDASTNVLKSGWNAVLLDPYGHLTQGGPLTVAKNPSLFAPFVTNFYYQATVPPLFNNDIYKAYINLASSSCQPLLVGSFAT